MQIHHLTGKDYKVSQWSGGTTTEIFIWPKDADYATRQFRLRISSATVELAENDFTALPGVIRYIVPLRGGFTLTHPGCEAVKLAALDTPYRFSGEIPTHCVGKATDFNLMLKNAEGEMEVCGVTAAILPGVTCLYAAEGAVITLENREYCLASAEALLIFAQSATAATITGGPVIRCHGKI